MSFYGALWGGELGQSASAEADCPSLLVLQLTSSFAGSLELPGCGECSNTSKSCSAFDTVERAFAAASVLAFGGYGLLFYLEQV